MELLGSVYLTNKWVTSVSEEEAEAMRECLTIIGKLFTNIAHRAGKTIEMTASVGDTDSQVIDLKYFVKDES